MATKHLFPAVAILTLALGVSPALAGQHARERSGSQERNSGSGDQKADRNSGGHHAQEARPEARPQARPENRSEPRRDPSPSAQPRPAPERNAPDRNAPDRGNVQDRSRGNVQDRGRGNVQGRDVQPRTGERAVPRTGVVPRDYRDNNRGDSRGRYVAPRGYYSHGRFISPRTVIIVPERRFYRPYYAFRPRFTIGIGVFVGYPVAYPYYYPDPYAYPPPTSGYPDPYYGSSGSVAISPSTAAGGVSFDIRPADAEIYVDGEFVGETGDFAPTMQPLTLYAGRHRIEVRAPGYVPLVFDADVVSGQVIPYQGALQPLRPF
jgi:PEGA domain-containing protein